MGRQKLWYSEGLRFECNRCGDCCRGEPGYVWVSPNEISLIARYLALSLPDFYRRYVRLVGGDYSLMEKPNGDCVFYKEGCLIYPVRPVQCRTFPFWPEYLSSPRMWRIAMLRCPGAGKGKLYTVDEIQEYLRMLEASVKGA